VVPDRGTVELLDQCHGLRPELGGSLGGNPSVTDERPEPLSLESLLRLLYGDSKVIGV